MRAAQSSHWSVIEVGVLIQAPCVTVRIWPCCGVPAMVGSTVLTGARGSTTAVGNEVSDVADAPPEVAVPADFAAALAADEQAGAFFWKLSNSLQRYHVDSITGAKSADTRQRRIDKAVALFRAGRQR